ncbi:MAG: glycoside hydrolase family 140 protein [Mucilaginibacter polytrichastri]|nr:glycoside hydrolase family 140 protein [Mucilaginibacter polytrichastri]
MFKKFLLAGCLLAQTAAFAQFTVSENHRYLLRDGKPFFWLGDTAWELFHRLNLEDADRYLKKRSEQGFTVVQAVVLSELNGMREPNANGDIPFFGQDLDKPNEKYFRHIDALVDKAASYGITIAMLPAWGDKLNKSTWGEGPEIFNEKNAAHYAAWLAARYKNRKNIIWVLGGDRNPRNESDVRVWQAMGNAIRKETGGKMLITFHPQPNQKGSAEWFHADQWLSFNMFQTGHCRDEPVYDKIAGAYALSPAKPVLDGEPIYEDHPVCFNANDLGLSSAYDVRRSAYLDLFAGAFGHTYGCHDIWQMHDQKHEGINGSKMFWFDAVDLPGANQMRFVRKLLESHPVSGRVPDQSMLADGNTNPAERVQATRGKGYAYVYSTAGKPFTLNLGKVGGENLRCYWYDPRNGKSSGITTVKNAPAQQFVPPSAGYGKDWILVIDDENMHYPTL